MSTQTQNFAGLTDGQVRIVLRKIASQADLMAHMCRGQAELAGESDAAYTFHALSTMLCSLGALADMPLGSAVSGGFGDWMLGPLFSPKQGDL